MKLPRLSAKTMLALPGLALAASVAFLLLSGLFSGGKDTSASNDELIRLPSGAEAAPPDDRPGSIQFVPTLAHDSLATRQAKALSELKQKWLKLGTELGGHTVKGPHRKLADASIVKLSIGEEMVELIELLERSGFPALAGLLKRKVAERLHSTDAGPARAALAALVNDSKTPRLFVRNWVYEAGSGCADDDAYQSFRAAIRDEDIARNAVYGRGMALVSTDPYAATSMIVANLGPASKGEILVMMFQELPGNTDFAKIEQQLPSDQSGANADGIRSGRAELLRRWSQIDFGAAVSFVIANPERVDPSAMRAIAAGFAESDAAAAVSWVQDLPPGLHFDHAIHGMMSSLGRDYPREASELASLVSDPEIRRASYESLESIARGEDTDGARMPASPAVDR